MQTWGFKTAVHKPMGDIMTTESIIYTIYGESWGKSCFFLCLKLQVYIADCPPELYSCEYSSCSKQCSKHVSNTAELSRTSSALQQTFSNYTWPENLATTDQFRSIMKSIKLLISGLLHDSAIFCPLSASYCHIKLFQRSSRTLSFFVVTSVPCRLRNLSLTAIITKKETALNVKAQTKIKYSL